MDHIQPNYTLDAQGLCCPEPVMLVRKQIRNMNNDEILLVLTDDPASKRDIPSFCEFMDHKLLHLEIDNAPFRFWLKKGL